MIMWIESGDKFLFFAGGSTDQLGYLATTIVLVRFGTRHLKPSLMEFIPLYKC